jgi:hypothetical protein
MSREEDIIIILLQLKNQIAVALCVLKRQKRENEVWSRIIL